MQICICICLYHIYIYIIIYAYKWIWSPCYIARPWWQELHAASFHQRQLGCVCVWVFHLVLNVLYTRAESDLPIAIPGPNLHWMCLHIWLLTASVPGPFLQCPREPMDDPCVCVCVCVCGVCVCVGSRCTWLGIFVPWSSSKFLFFPGFSPSPPLPRPQESQEGQRDGWSYTGGSTTLLVADGTKLLTSAWMSVSRQLQLIRV